MSAFSTRRWQASNEHIGLGGSATRTRIACSPLILASLLFGVPVALGIAVSLIRLVGLRYPYLGWATTVNSDAEQLYLGHTLYQNPAHGYTGQIYTPGFPTVVSLLDRLYLWNGWPLLLVIGATVALIVLCARVAYNRCGPAPRVVNIVGAAGVGAIAYWCVASVGLSLLDEGRADQVAWAFALSGLIAVADLGPSPSRRRVVVAALLLSAGIWTKQTTIAVTALAFAWVLGLAAISALNRRAALLFTAVLCGMNLVILLVLNLLTHGWEFYINFVLATHQANEFTYSENLAKGLRSSALGIGFVAVMWLAGLAAVAIRRRDRRELAHPSVGDRLRRLLVAEDPAGRRILLLAVYVVFGFVLAMYFMRKQGTETNQLIGVVWGLGLLAAAGWHVAQRHIGTAAAAGGCVAALFVLAQLGPVSRMAADAEVKIPEFEQATQWTSMPPELLAWASTHTLYTSLFADLNVPQGGPLYPNYYNFVDLLAGGNQPLYVVHALLDRRFEGVTYFSLEGDSYASGLGKWEENYLWKLDEVIAARYAPAAGVPEGVLARRPGPEQATWMRSCFGPFRAGGASFLIHRGGGFWCSFQPGGLALVRAPTPLSEVVSTQPVRLGGTIAVGFAGKTPGEVNLVLKNGSRPGWTARVSAAAGHSRELTVVTYLHGALLGGTRVTAAVSRDGTRTIKLAVTPTSGRPGAPISAAPGAVTLAAPTSKAPFALVARSGATIDLNAARLGR